MDVSAALMRTLEQKRWTAASQQPLCHHDELQRHDPAGETLLPAGLLHHHLHRGPGGKRNIHQHLPDEAASLEEQQHHHGQPGADRPPLRPQHALLVHYYSNGESWPFSDFMCSYVRFGFHFNLYGSILFLTCLAVFRYVVVLKPLMAAQVEQKLWGICACTAVWIIAAAGTINILQIISLDKDQNKTCRDFASTEPVEQVHLYSWGLTAIGFLLPLVVVVMCYIGIVKQLTQGPYTTSPCRMRARRVTVLVLVVFVVCFLPYHILRVLRIETRRMENPECMMYNIVDVLYIISRPLAGLNTVFNLALYTLSGDRFRKAFLSTFNFERWLTKARSLLHLTTHNKAANDRPAEG
ncbi:hypothetical protein INR49_000818, partial [Caranx melampygus]